MHALPWEILFYNKNMQIVEKVTKKKNTLLSPEYSKKEGKNHNKASYSFTKQEESRLTMKRKAAYSWKAPKLFS